jgi:hypothetical protein
MFGFATGLMIASMLLGLVADITPTWLMALANFASWALVGAFVGSYQCLQLRTAVRGLRWWIAANALGYGLGMLAVILVSNSQEVSIFVYALAGFMVGVTTLLALLRLKKVE